MSAHTPGPWFAGEAFHHSGERQRVTPIYARDPDVLDGRWLIAWCHQNAVPSKQVKPNARLIATAPELLDALAGMTALAKGPAGGVTVEMKRSAIAKAEAAIAKATQP
jgi:hypothetical protein